MSKKDQLLKILIRQKECMKVKKSKKKNNT